MEYLIIILIIYVIILTLFIIRINNKVENLSNNETPPIIIKPSELSNADYIPTIPTPPPTEEDYTKLAEQFEKAVGNKTRNEIEEWIKEENKIKTLNNLNRDYKAY